ncbi:heparinase II/III family protein [uncultured Fusobacterium sp.]|uniref:heparinase II/III domain-containing protein n=1 Tax=uncultured Fusobacterium sp. TaxID=159267 RepID=UPI0025F5D34A|nr:heparinase II/III family protein [uncultured Fusobacterium sp.]
MEYLKKVIKYYKATFNGEIIEKCKRKILIKTGVLKKINFINTNETEVKINPKFLFDLKVSINENFEKNYKIFDKELELLKKVEWFEENKKSDLEWFNEKITTFKDIKVVWEINRLQFLTYLSLGNRKKEGLLLLNDWIENNEYNKGINWYSNLEVAIRSISIINFLFMIGSEYLEKYRNLIYLHGKHIFKDITYTEKCIPNNHLIGEASALYCIANLLEIKEKEKWLNKSKKILKKYLNHLHDDGTYEEASLSYHRFVIQMYLIVYLFSKKTNDDFIEKEIEDKLKKAYIFLKALKKPNIQYPDFGDNDEGFFYKLGLEENFDSFVKSIGNFLKQEEYYGEIQKLFQIYQIENDIEYEKMENKIFFPKGKYFVYKDKRNYIFVHNQNQEYHSHSDGMSIELVLDNKNILVDSGTFNYNIDKKKRKYYRSTLSHNTVWMDGDQAEQIGSFRWIDGPETKLEYFESDNKYFIKGNIKTNKRKEHIRKIEFDRDFNEIKIEDEISNVDNFILNWIFSEEMELEKITERKYEINRTDYEIEIFSKENIKIELLKCNYSTEYNIEKETRKIQIKNQEKKPIYKIITIFRKRKDL